MRHCHETTDMKPTVKLLFSLFYILACLTLAQEEPAFHNVSAQAGITAAHRAVWDPDGTGEGYLAVGQAWGDYDNDGLLDLYVTGNLARNVLYHNDGDGTFSVSPLSKSVSLPNVSSGGALWADYDNDGWRDLYVVNSGANVLFHNDGGEGFSDVSSSAGVGDTGKGASATWGDYDGDGYLDLYVVNWSCLPECQPEDVSLSRDTLYHNLGDGTFEDATALLEADKTLGAGFAASFFDYDNDGDADLYVVNDKMANPIGNVLWRNDGPGCGAWCFTDVSAAAGVDAKMHSMGLAVGDYDNDGNQDVFATNMMSPMALERNLGDGRFEDSSAAAGVQVLDTHREAVGWGTSFFDYDNDGRLDLYLATSAMAAGPPGMYGGQQPNMEDMHHPYPDLLYRNDGDGAFSPVPLGDDTDEHATMGFAYADYDDDGRVDFVQGNWNEGYALYHNDSSAESNWLTVDLVGDGTVNRDAAGARVYLTDSDGVTQMREVILGSSLGAGNDPRLHFGLGAATVDTLSVVWPNGLKQTFQQVPHNQVWQLRYVNGSDDAAVATEWFALVLDLVKDSPGFTPPVASRAFGYMGVTLYEAVAPGLDGYQSLASQLNGLGVMPTPEPSQSYHWPSVANSALASISTRLFGSASPEAQAKIEALELKFAHRFALQTGVATFAASVEQGRAVADAVYAWSSTDGGETGYARNFPKDYPPPTAPGLWVSTPPGYATAMLPGWGGNRPFLATSNDCQVQPPLAYSEDPASAFYAEAREVYQTVKTLTPEQREIARFWADNPGETATPPGHWVAIATNFLKEGGYSLEKASVAYAELGVALADAFIACWQAKYQYNLIRPISYIQKVIDADWNAAALTDPVVTPPFPEYPSGHSVQSAAAAWVLTDLFGETPFTDHSHDRDGFAPRTYTSFMEAAQEAAISRLYGGIHYRAAIENGLEQGTCIGRKVVALRVQG